MPEVSYASTTIASAHFQKGFAWQRRENHWFPLKGVELSPANCGAGKIAFMAAPIQTPWLWSGLGKESNSTGLRISEAEPWSSASWTWGWLQATWGDCAKPCCPPEGWRLSWGMVAGCHVELEGEKGFLCVFSTVVEFYGIVLLFLQCWLWTNTRRQFIS